jgi:hypothetical protein
MFPTKLITIRIYWIRLKNSVDIDNITLMVYGVKIFIEYELKVYNKFTVTGHYAKIDHLHISYFD